MQTDTKERRAPINTKEAAAYLGFTPNWLEKLRVMGGGPAYLKRGSAVRYFPDDLDSWLEAGKRRSTSQEVAHDAA